MDEISLREAIEGEDEAVRANQHRRGGCGVAREISAAAAEKSARDGRELPPVRARVRRAAEEREARRREKVGEEGAAHDSEAAREGERGEG